MSTEKLLALIKFGVEYHSGQWSRGYRLQCRATQLLRNRFDEFIVNRILDNLLGEYTGFSAKTDSIYRQLVKSHADSV